MGRPTDDNDDNSRRDVLQPLRIADKLPMLLLRSIWLAVSIQTEHVSKVVIAQAMLVRDMLYLALIIGQEVQKAIRAYG